MKIGKNSVAYGNVPQDLELGDESVIVGPTDQHGNTIINGPMAVGRNAQAGPNSIAIGSGANAGGGINLVAALHELSEIAQKSDNKDVLSELSKILAEIKNPQPDKSVISKAWEGVKTLGSINGAHTLISKISIALSAIMIT